MKTKPKPASDHLSGGFFVMNLREWARNVVKSWRENRRAR